jgi:peroxiredoxin
MTRIDGGISFLMRFCVIHLILLSTLWVLSYGSLALAAEGGAPGIAILNPPEKAPDFTLPAIDGQKTSLSDLNGRVVLLNFWATWCDPCRDEMPAMEQLWEKYKGQGFVILAVSLDTGSQRRVVNFAKRLGLTYPILLDPEESVGERFKVFGLPTSFFIARNGMVTGKVAGPLDWAGPKVASYIEELLHVK